MASTQTPKRTPLYAAHQQCGAKMVPFGGWEMPVQYTSIIEEHRAVRERAGLFDVSHMGEVLVAGPRAETYLNHLLTNDVRTLAVEQAQYTLLCNDAGGVIDDLIVYRLEPTVYLAVINAACIEKDWAWLTAHAESGVVLQNRSNQTGALALQGPKAADLLPEAADVAHFHIRRKALLGKECTVACTGYTGEDGFELLCAAGDIVHVWNELLGRGAQPVGLGARDTLRLEMCYPLNGSDLTEQTTPVEAGLSRYVAFDKGDFVGRDVLVSQKEKGVNRKLVAFEMTGKSPPPRPHYAILAGERIIGEVTSGTQSPTMGIGIGMGYVEVAAGQVGATIGIEIRGQNYPAVIETKPLLKRGK